VLEGVLVDTQRRCLLEPVIGGDQRVALASIHRSIPGSRAVVA
jgi:hypothetical protein